MRRTFAIGDIHGCRRLLVKLLARLDADPGHDTLIILGDFINRGPDSWGTIELLLGLAKQYRHMVVLRGNHEQMLLDYLDGRDQGIFLATGGRATLASYGVNDSTADFAASWLPSNHRQWLSALPSSYENEHGIYVHAGLQPRVHLSQQSTEWLLWSRHEFIDSDYDFGKPVVFGHTPFDQPLITRNRIGIDTGAVYGGKLSCVVLPSQRIISV